jgi:hypothetical protein
MDDDLDTGSAIQAMTEIGRDILEADDTEDVSDAQQTLAELASVLGLAMDRS